MIIDNSQKIEEDFLLKSLNLFNNKYFNTNFNNNITTNFNKIKFQEKKLKFESELINKKIIRNLSNRNKNNIEELNEINNIMNEINTEINENNNLDLSNIFKSEKVEINEISLYLKNNKKDKITTDKIKKKTEN